MLPMKQVAFLSQQSRHTLFALLKLMMFTLTVTFASTSMLPSKLLGVESGDDLTYVVMREEVELPAGRVQIGDIADIRGGPAPRRLQIARLELEENASPGSELIISQRRVVYRIRLAGIHPDTVRIEGARMTRVRFKQTGSVSATSGDVVLVAARSLQPGELLSPSNTRTEHRVGETNAVSPNAAYGRAVSRNISPNQVIRAEHIASAEQTTVIKKGEFVRMIARVGVLEISTRGEALADGKIGQVIPVRNVDSKQVVHARVLRPATVQVDY